MFTTICHRVIVPAVRRVFRPRVYPSTTLAVTKPVVRATRRTATASVAAKATGALHGAGGTFLVCYLAWGLAGYPGAPVIAIPPVTIPQIGSVIEPPVGYSGLGFPEGGSIAGIAIPYLGERNEIIPALNQVDFVTSVFQPINPITIADGNGVIPSNPTAVDEPNTLILFATAIVLWFITRRKRT